MSQLMSLTNAQQNSLRATLRGAVKFDEPMRAHTTMQVGGPADAWVQPLDVPDLLAVVQWSKSEGLPLVAVGRGSNLLVRDGGIRGVAIHLSALDALRTADDCPAPQPDTVVLYAQAGVKLKRLLGFCAEHGFSGLEGLEGVPGTMGGAVMMNAGTPAGAIGDAIFSVTYLDKHDELITKTAAQLAFSYRKSKIPKSAIVVSALLVVTPTLPEAVRGRLQQLRDKREKAQPATQPGVGSVFRNPPHASAWSLIDDAGLRGVRIGKARVSEQHANWIINEGGATAHDVECLIRLMRDQVREKCGVSLEPEVIVVGEETHNEQ